MSVATSIKLPAELKVQIEETAKKAGLSAHAFMVKTLADATQRHRLQEQFQQDSLDALHEMEDTGLAYAWDDVKVYLKARALNRDTPRPELKPIR